MDAEEIAWLDAYHARVRKVLSPLVDTPTRRWLAQATRPVKARPLELPRPAGSRSRLEEERLGAGALQLA